MITASGCAATPEPIYCEPVTLEKDRIVPVPEFLVKPVEIARLSADFDVYELGAAYQYQTVRLEQCNGRLAEIGNLSRYKNATNTE